MPKPISEFVNRILCGNTLNVLREMPDESVDCVISSPPYYSLRDYGEQTKTIWDGDKDCQHEWISEEFKQHSGRGDAQKSGKYSEQEPIPDKQLQRDFCQKCGAWYGQLGLEPTLEMYLYHMLQVTAELKRIMKPTATLWLNMGTSYSNGKTKIMIKEWYD